MNNIPSYTLKVLCRRLALVAADYPGQALIPWLHHNG